MTEQQVEPGPERPRRFFTLEPVSVDLGDALVQVFAVALGVIIGFAVTSWNDREHQRSLLHATVGNIVAELRANQNGMKQVIAGHEQAADSLRTAVFRARPKRSLSLVEGQRALNGIGPFRMNIPLGIAWQIAQSDQGLTLLPYQDRYDLAWVYQLQDFYYQAEQRFENSLLTVSESPTGNYYFQAVNLMNQEQSVVATERRLMQLYGDTIAHLQKEFQV
jgi:hypothetical protein